MLQDWININNCKKCYEKISSEKNLLKPLKITIFWPNFHNNGVPMGHTQNKKKIFLRNNKTRSKAFKNCLFYQNIICFGWVINVFLCCLMLFCFKVSFPAITAVIYKQSFWNRERFEYYFGKSLKKTKTKITSSRWLQFKSSWLYYDTNLIQLFLVISHQ